MSDLVDMVVQQAARRKVIAEKVKALSIEDAAIMKRMSADLKRHHDIESEIAFLVEKLTETV